LVFTSRRAGDRADLLSGDASATRWARHWRLPPRLARLAILLVAGVVPTDIAGRLGISVRSARAYTEALFQLAGVTSRNQLHVAMLRAGKPPERAPS
jgi:DNA-binding NarL/FixJ family response regulator